MLKSVSGIDVESLIKRLTSGRVEVPAAAVPGSGSPDPGVIGK
jgi:hypothetical protein